MLLSLTTLVDFGAMAMTLWLGLYLLSKSFPHPIAMRAVLMLLAISIFFFGAYYNLFHQVEGSAAWRAVMLIIGLGTWYSLVCQLMSVRSRARLRWLEIVIYALGAISIILLLSTRNAFVREQGNVLYVAHMGMGLPYTVYGIFQLIVAVSLLFNLLSGDRVGLTSAGRYFLLGSFFPALAVGYGVIGLISPEPLPRLIQDFLTFCGVFFIGAAVARHQAWVERRITLPDFPVSGITVLGLSGLYAILAWRWGLEPRLVAFVMVFAILTHSIYDYAREFLERLRVRHDSAFRQKLRELESEKPTEQTLRLRLDLSLGLLCQTLDASGGFIAVQRGNEYLVTASQESLPLNSCIAAELVSAEDVIQSQNSQLPGIAWIAPVFEDRAQVAVIGLGKPQTRLGYSADGLDLLAEVADRIGTLLSLSEIQHHRSEQIQQAIAEIQADSAELNSSADELVLAITTNPEAEFVKIVEDGLRHLTDYILLGQSPLAERMGMRGESHIERGKALHQKLLESIESLRPAGPRPREPLPRLWYSFVVLHDAYVEGVPNREIMSRLYISEGTFNRTRRNALRGLARLLLEKNKSHP